MQMRTFLLLTVQLIVISLISVSVVTAQSTEQCRALLSQALTNLASQCSDVSVNSACYGFETVTATFSEAAPEGFFSAPGDIAELGTTVSISTSPASFQDSTLGLSLLNVQANLDELSGQHAVFLLLGGQEIESGVEPDSEFTPMQSFFLSRDVEQSDCSTEIPAMLFIQGPEEAPVELTVYSIPIRIESTIIVRTIPATETSPAMLEFIVLSGQLVINPGTPNEIVVPAGFAISVAFADGPAISLGAGGDADEMQLGTAFSPIRPLSDDEIDLLSALVAGIPASLLNYDVIFPPTTPITETPPTPTTGGTTGGTVVGGTVPVTPVCSSFALTSPLQGMAYGLNTVYWNPAIGVTGYVVMVTNLDNGQSSSVAVGPGATNAQIDTSTLGGGFNFQLSVAALGNAGIVCQDVRTMQRAAAPGTGGDSGDGEDEADDDECPPGQQPSGVGGACIPIP